MKKFISFLAVAISTTGLAGSAMAEDATYPDRAITLIVPYPAGGTIDRIARELADVAATEWGQAVVVENQGGGNGLVGVERARNSNPDGYTILVAGGSTHSLGPAIDPNVKYDPINDFSTIAYLGDTPLVVTGGPSVEGRSMADIIDEAKDDARAFTYGSVGNTTVLATQLLASDTGAKLTHVNYQQFGQALIDIARGDVDLGVSSLSIAAAPISQGMLTPLAVTSPERVKLLPEVSSIAESVPDYEMLIWFGLFGQPELDEEVREKWFDLVQDWQADEARVEKWAKEGFTLRQRSAQEFADYLRADYEKWQKVAAETGLNE